MIINRWLPSILLAMVPLMAAGAALPRFPQPFGERIDAQGDCRQTDRAAAATPAASCLPAEWNCATAAMMSPRIAPARRS
jgi:zona occludens toxin (predicted ATPase)